MKALIRCGVCLVLCVACVLCADYPRTVGAGGSFALRAISSAAVHHVQAPRIRNADGSSTNWSGYAVEGIAAPSGKGTKPAAAPTVGEAVGTWVVPEVAESD